MKIFVFIFLILMEMFWNENLVAQVNGLVRLNGKQFYDDSGALFPTILNYYVKAYYDPSTQTYFLESVSYPNVTLNDEFTEIENLNFNTVRLLVSGGMGPRFQFNALDHVSSLDFTFDNIGGGITTLSLIPDLNTQPNPYDNSSNQTNLGNIIPRYDDVINVASQHRIRVLILDGGVDAWKNEEAVEHTGYFQSLLADHYKNNPAVFGWDLHNEPSKELPRPYPKQWACEKVNYLYNSVKDYDPNHLITVGGFGFDDIFIFDPYILKVDFYSLHEYPTNLSDENKFKLINDGIYQSLQLIKIHSQAYWLNNVLNKPYIIGETGYNSENGLSALDTLMNGTTMEAVSYLKNVFQYCKDCGFSGFSWFQFQPGLVYFGAPPLSGLEKDDICDSVRLLNWNNLTQNPCSIDPVDYYNPHHWPINANTEVVNGTVVDQDHHPIPNAFILGKMKTHTDSIVPSHTDPDQIGTFSKDDGTFTIIPNPGAFDGLDDISGLFTINEPTEKFNDISLSAAGCNIKIRPLTDNGVTFPIDVSAQGETFVLDKHSLDYNNVIQSLNLQNEVKKYYAWNSISVINNNFIDHYSSADFTARNEIIINSEFLSEAGSETHIFTSAVFYDCSLASNSLYRKANNYFVSSTAAFQENEKEIILKFSNENSDIIIIPNPFEENFNVISSFNKESFPINFSIYDIYGNKVLTGKLNNNNENISLLTDPGFYLIVFYNSNYVNTQKLIVQK